MRIALLGGSFNPPHNGHIQIAQAVLNKMHYNNILFVPAFIPPHKDLSIGAQTEDRIAMLKASIKNNDSFKLELCEIERGGVSYTIDTVRFLRRKYKNLLEGKIGVILGDDLLEGFYLWKEAELLAQEADLIVAKRIKKEAHIADKPFLYPHKDLQNECVFISSSHIRELILQKKSFYELVPPAVYEYITKRKLYEETI